MLGRLVVVFGLAGLIDHYNAPGKLFITYPEQDGLFSAEARQLKLTHFQVEILTIKQTINQVNSSKIGTTLQY